MAEVLSDIVTDRDATPPVRQDVTNFGGVLRETLAIVASSATEAITTNFVMMPIPSNARMSELSIRHAEAGTTGQGNIGVMRLVDGAYTFTGGDADFFASAYDFDDAGVATDAWVDVTFESGVYTEALANLALWEAIGLTEDPNEELFVAIDVSEVFLGGPTSISMRARYAY